MNLDTDMQWAFWDGVHDYYKSNKDYLQGQLGNPEEKINQTKNTTTLEHGSGLENKRL